MSHQQSLNPHLEALLVSELDGSCAFAGFNHLAGLTTLKTDPALSSHCLALVLLLLLGAVDDQELRRVFGFVLEGGNDDGEGRGIGGRAVFGLFHFNLDYNRNPKRLQLWFLSMKGISKYSKGVDSQEGKKLVLMVLRYLICIMDCWLLVEVVLVGLEDGSVAVAGAGVEAELAEPAELAAFVELAAVAERVVFVVPAGVVDEAVLVEAVVSVAVAPEVVDWANPVLPAQD